MNSSNHFPNQSCLFVYSLFKSLFENNEDKYDVKSFQTVEHNLLNHSEKLNCHVHKGYLF